MAASAVGLGEDLDDAIAYAADAAEFGLVAVWTTRTERTLGEIERVWPEQPAA